MSNPTPTREDRERAADAMPPSCLDVDYAHWIETGEWDEEAIEAGGDVDDIVDHVAQAIATARAEERAAAAQREAVHLALIAELALVLETTEASAHIQLFGTAYPFEPSELVTRARDATRNVRREDDRA